MLLHGAHLIELERVRHVLEEALVSVVHKQLQPFSFELFGYVCENESLDVCCSDQLTVITFAFRV